MGHQYRLVFFFSTDLLIASARTLLFIFIRKCPTISVLGFRGNKSQSTIGEVG